MPPAPTSPTPTQSGAIVRGFVDRDKDAVFALYARVFGKEPLERFASRWQWQFFDTPAAHAAPLLHWVAEAPDGTTVGYLAAFPTRLKAMDREEVIYHDCDLIVAPEARRQGLAERLVRSYDACPSVLSSAIAYAPANGRLRQRLGYRAVHLVPVLIRPRNLGPILRFYVVERGPAWLRALPARLLLQAATALGSPLVRGWHAARSPRAGAVAVEPIESAGGEFDAVWGRVSPAFPFVVVRDRRFVQWRFFDDPAFANRVFLARDNSGQPAGYVVVRVAARGSLRVGRVVDLFCDPGQPGVARALLAAGLRWLDQEGADLTTCVGLAPSLRRVARGAFLVPPSRFDHPSWLLWKGDPARAALVYDAAAWHISSADSDIGLTP